MKYKICDWVRVRQWDDLCQEYRKDDHDTFDEFGFNTEMQKLCGRWGKITDICGDACRISFKGVDHSWVWNDAMLESNEPYKVGDQVIVSSMDALNRDFDMNRCDQSINPTFFTKSKFESLFQDPVLATIKDIRRKSTGVYRYHISCKENTKLEMYLFSGYEFCPAVPTSLPQVVPTLSFSELFSDAAM
mgnify:FL=1